MKSRERTRDAAAQTSRDTVSLCRDESQEMRNFPPNRTRRHPTVALTMHTNGNIIGWRFGNENVNLN